MKRSLTLYLLLVATINLFSQQPNNNSKNITISGKVIEGETKLLLEYATITVSNTIKTINGTISDKKGTFKIAVPKGSYIITVSYLGYKSFKINTRDYLSNTKLDTILLFPDSEKLNEVTITAKKKRVDINIDKKIYDVENEKTNRGKTSTEILNTIPSVDVNAEGSVSLRGNANPIILIDGNPSTISGNNLNTFLLQLPAESISKIEVVTNPSSRYDAQGVSGIINIILKKRKSNNLGIATTISTGIPDNHGISSSLSYSKNKMRIYATAFYKYIDITGRGKINQEYIAANNITTITKENRTDIRLLKLLYGNGGLFYRFENKSSFNAFFNIGRTVNNNKNSINYIDSNSNTSTNSNRTAKEDEEEFNSDISLSYKKPFKDNSELSIQLKLESSNENQNSKVQTVFNNISQEDILQFVDADEKQNVQVIQVDYELPTQKIKNQFDFGYKFIRNSLENDYQIQQLTNSVLVPLDGFNEDFKNMFKVNALYAQYNKKMNKWSFTTGLRIENTNQNISFNNSSEIVKKDYTNVFPSAFLNYNINNNQVLRLNYSKRIRRPDVWTLNPFLSFSNDRNFFSGNPDLDPIYSDSYELNYVFNKKNKTLDLAVYHQKSKGIINYIIEQTNEVTSNGNVIFKRFPINNGTENKTGIDINGSLNITKDFKISTNVNFYKSMVTKTLNNLFDTNQWLWFGKITTNYKLPLDINSQLTLRYRGPRKNQSYESEGAYIGDLFLNKDILKGNGTLAINIVDVFNTLESVSRNIRPNFFSESSYKYRKRQLNFSFTYRFNKRKRRAYNREQEIKDDFEY